MAAPLTSLAACIAVRSALRVLPPSPPAATPDPTLQRLFDPPHAHSPWVSDACRAALRRPRGMARAVSWCTPAVVRVALDAGCTRSEVRTVCNDRMGNFSWLGGDCASSLRLPSHGVDAVLWLFGDTLLGTLLPSGSRQLRGCQMPHQSIGLQPNSSAPIQYTWDQTITGGDGTSYNTVSMFTPRHGFVGHPDPSVSCARPFSDLRPYYWVVQGIESGTVDPSGTYLPPGRLFLLAVRVAGTPGVGLGFRVLGTTAIVVRDSSIEPSKWAYDTKDITTCYDAASCETWATAISIAPTSKDCVRCVYILGGLSRAGKQSILRSPLDHLLLLDFSAAEVLADDGVWRPRVPGASTSSWPHRAMGLFTQQPSTTLYFSPYLNQWLSASTNAFAGSELVLWSSEGADVAGPWRSEPLYKLPMPWADSTKFFACTSVPTTRLVKQQTCSTR